MGSEAALKRYTNEIQTHRLLGSERLGRMVPNLERCIHGATSVLFILLWMIFFMSFSMVVSCGVVTTVAWIARGAVAVGAQPAFVSILNSINLISDDHAAHLKANLP